MSKVNVYFKVIDEITLPILLWIHKVRSRNIQIWYDKNIAGDKTIISKFKTKLDIEFEETDGSISFFEWQLSKNGVECLFCGLKDLISRSCSHKTDFIIIDNIRRNNNQMILFRDAVHNTDLPDSFIKVPCFTTIDEVISHCKAQGVFAFSLDDTTKFSFENGISPVQGAKVYKEISTGKLWYIDMLHKDHYEVFDSTGKIYIGEASIDGQIDTSKKDSDKKAIK